MRGALIVFEGADRSGKSTQARLFTTALQKAGVTVAEHAPWSFPDRTTPTGRIINSYLTNAADVDHHALHLLFSANRWEKVSRIRDALTRGETVVLDRYAYSGVAYSVANGLPLQWTKCADQGLPAPDLVLYLQLSAGAAAKRAGFGSERYENNHMQSAVVRAFDLLRTKHWLIIDADADQHTVLHTILDRAMPIVAQATNRDCIQTLWN
ncbi:unnamed protein product [Agarophyton chilense]